MNGYNCHPVPSEHFANYSCMYKYILYTTYTVCLSIEENDSFVYCTTYRSIHFAKGRNRMLALARLSKDRLHIKYKCCLNKSYPLF